MDLIYMSDAMAYQSVRGPLSSYYDRSWDKPISASHKSQDKYQKSVSSSNRTCKPKSNQNRHGSGSEACKICKEQQRRALRVYIRSKSHEERDARCIVEENEEDEEQDQGSGSGSGCHNQKSTDQ